MLDRNDRLRRRLTWTRVSLSAAALVMLSLSTAQAQINTIPGWNGSGFISSFGVTNTATYGETISVPAGASPLNSFSFEIGYCSNSVTFRGEVYAWDGTKATGPALFESATQTVAAGSSYQLVTFNTGGLTLTPGAYVLFASTSRDQGDAPPSSCRWGSVGNNTAYAGGQFVYMNNGPDPTQWTLTTWSIIAQDLAFAVDGLVVAAPVVSNAAGAPAASTVSLLIGFAALAGLGLFRLSRHGHVV